MYSQVYGKFDSSVVVITYYDEVLMIIYWFSKVTQLDMSLKEQQSHLQQQLGNTETHLVEVKRELEEKVIQVTKTTNITCLRVQKRVKLSFGYQSHWWYLISSRQNEQNFPIPGAVYHHKIHKQVTESHQLPVIPS